MRMMIDNAWKNIASSSVQDIVRALVCQILQGNDFFDDLILKSQRCFRKNGFPVSHNDSCINNRCSHKVLLIELPSQQSAQQWARSGKGAKVFYPPQHATL